MSDITCDYCGEGWNNPEQPYFLRGTKPDGWPRWACPDCMGKIYMGVIEDAPPYISTPLGEVPIDKQRP